MSKMAILRSACRLLSAFTVAFSFSLKVSASRLSPGTHASSPSPYSLMDAGRQPNGGMDVTPIRRAPSLYSSCNTYSIARVFNTKQARMAAGRPSLIRMTYVGEAGEDADEEVAVLVDVVAAGQRGVVVVVLEEVAGARADDVERVGEDGASLGAPGHRGQLRLVLLVVLELLGQRDRVLHVCASRHQTYTYPSLADSLNKQQHLSYPAKNGWLLHRSTYSIHTCMYGTYIHGRRVVVVAGRRGGEVGTDEQVLPGRLRAEVRRRVALEAERFSCNKQPNRTNSFVTQPMPS